MSAKVGNKGVEYIIRVIDYATGPFKKIQAALSGTSDKFVDLTKKIESESLRSAAKIAEGNQKIINSYDKVNAAAGRLSFKENASQKIDKITGSLNNALKTAIKAKADMQGIGIREKAFAIKDAVVNFSVRDYATTKVQAIQNKLAAVKDKVANFSVRDYASAKVQAIQNKLAAVKDKVANFSVRDYASAKVQAIETKMAAVKDKAVAIQVMAKDAATEKIQAIKNRLASIKDKITSVNLKDRASAAIDRITGSANNAMKAIINVKGQANSIGIRDAVSPVFRRIGAEAQSLKSRAVAAFESMKAKIKGVGDEAEKTEKKVKGLSMGKMMLGLFSGLAIGATVASGFNAAMDGAIKREKDIAGLTTFVGDNARNVYNAIQKDAAVTPFNTDSLLDVNRALISSGLEADKARKDALNLANAISAVGKGNAELANMAANMQQIKTVGKASSMDIKQFAFAGINVYEMLSKATGKSIKDVQEMDVSYELLSKALEKAAGKGGIYEGALERQGKTMGAMIETAKDTMSIFLTDFGESLKPVAGRFLELFQKIVEKAPQVLSAIQPFVVKVADLFLWLVSMAGKLIKGIGWLWEKFTEGNPIIIVLAAIVGGLIVKMIAMQTWALAVAAAKGVWAAAQWVLNTAIIANPIGLWIAAIIALIALIAVIIYKYDGWGAAWSNLINYLSSSWMEFKSGFEVVWIEIQSAFSSGINALKSKWLEFKSIWNKEDAQKGLAEIDNQAKAWEAKLSAAKKVNNAYANQAKSYGSNIFNQIKDNGKDVVGDLKNKFGIGKSGAAAVVEKITADKSKANATGGKDLKSAAGAGKDKAKSINEGGSRPTTINITIQKLQDQIVINANSVKEGAKQAATDVVNEIYTALYSLDGKSATQ